MGATASWPKRFFALDVSRGFAALAVVFWHWQHFAFTGTSMEDSFRRSSLPFYGVLRPFYERGFMGVDYFFMLSGFIFFWLYRDAIARRRVGLGRFWSQRFSRLYPLHLATLLLVALLQHAYAAHTGDTFVYPNNNGFHFVLNLFMASKWGLEESQTFNGPSWSVSVEILCYMIFFLLAFLRLGGFWFCLALSAAAVFVRQHFVHGIQFAIGSIEVHFFKDIMRGLLFFWGGFLFHATARIASRRKARRAILAICALSWSAVLIDTYVFDLADRFRTLGPWAAPLVEHFIVYVLFSSTIVSLVVLELRKGSFARPLAWIGDLTYSSYLLHFPIQICIALLVSYGLIRPKFYLSPVALASFFLLLVPLSYATFRCFERPVQNALRRFFQRRSRSAAIPCADASSKASLAG
jgi:peptidoglycan/LPS O-acetylase OafA/YrhL